MPFHFTNAKGTLGFGDGRQVVVGKTLRVKYPRLVECGIYGLHSSNLISYALTYAPGCRLWEVSHPRGIVSAQHDKQVGVDRKAEKDFGDIREILVRFAKRCAEEALKFSSEFSGVAFYADDAVEAARRVLRYAIDIDAEAAACVGVAAISARNSARDHYKKELAAQEAWLRKELRRL